jgi:hypothetical protein
MLPPSYVSLQHTKTQKIKRIGLPLTKPRTLRSRVAAKADQPGFVRVQRQFERAQSLVQIVQKGLCLVLMLKTDDLVVGIAHDDHVAVRFGLAPSLDPHIARVVQVGVGKDW